MAARARRSPPDPPPEETGTDVRELEWEPWDRIEAVLQGVDESDRAGVTIYLYRLEPREERPPGMAAYLARYRGALDVDEVRESWGGGTYRVIVKGPDHSVIARQEFAISGVEPRGVRTIPRPAPSMPAAPPVAGVPVAPTDAAAGALAAIQPALGLIRDVMSVLHPPQTGPQQLTGMAEAVASIMKIGREAGGDSGETTTADVIVSAIKELGPRFVGPPPPSAPGAVGAGPSSAPPPQLAAPAAPWPAYTAPPAMPPAAPPATAPAPTPHEEAAAMLHHYAPQIQRLAQAARDGDDDHAWWAEWVLREAPMLAQLLAAVGPVRAQEAVRSYVVEHPELGPSQAILPWCEAVLRELYRDEPPPEEGEAAGGGNGSPDAPPPAA